MEPRNTDVQCPKCLCSSCTLCCSGARMWLRCHRCQADFPLWPACGYRLVVVPDPLT